MFSGKLIIIPQEIYWKKNYIQSSETEAVLSSHIERMK